jgi:exodeoxyribonuclease V alpha subunit
VVRLVVERRFGSVIGDLARAVREGRDDEVIALLRAGHREVGFVEPAGGAPGEEDIRHIREDAERAGLALVHAARAGDVAGALTALESHRLLVAHRRGRFGVSSWSGRVEAWVAAADHAPTDGPGRAGSRRAPGRQVGPWYPGRPILVTANDRDSGLYNGDAGVLVADPDVEPAPAGPGLPSTVPHVVAAFGDPARPILVRPHRLPPVETVHAMTVHRAQGSQFSHVDVLLPPEQSPLLTRELLYTALTRARSAVRVVGTERAVRAAVRRPVRRASGLRHG